MNIQAGNTIFAQEKSLLRDNANFITDKEEAAKQAPNVYLDDSDNKTGKPVSYQEKVREVEKAATKEGYQVTKQESDSLHEGHVRLSKAIESIRDMEQSASRLADTLQELRGEQNEEDSLKGDLQERADEIAEHDEERAKTETEEDRKDDKEEDTIKKENIQSDKDTDKLIRNFVNQYNDLLKQEDEKEENDKIKQFYENLKNDVEKYDKEFAALGIRVEEDGSLLFAKDDNSNQVKKMDAEDDALAEVEETIKEAREQREKYLPDTYLSYNQEQNYHLLAATGALYNGTL